VFCAKDSEDAAKMDMKIILIITVITAYFIVIVFYIHISLTKPITISQGKTISFRK
jgi:hypothetical protein